LQRRFDIRFRTPANAPRGEGVKPADEATAGFGRRSFAREESTTNVDAPARKPASF
jgi:hypothetical protein